MYFVSAALPPLFLSTFMLAVSTIILFPSVSLTEFIAFTTRSARNSGATPVFFPESAVMAIFLSIASSFAVTDIAMSCFLDSSAARWYPSAIIVECTP